MNAVEKHDGHVTARRDWLRTWLDERTAMDGRCRVWTLRMDSRNKPVAEVFGDRWVNVRRLAWREILPDERKQLPRGREIAPRCGNPRCMKHLAAMTRAQRVSMMYEQGLLGTAHHRARITAAARARSEFSLEKAREARALRESGMPLKAVAEAVGIGYHAAQKVCTNEMWRDGLAPGASVFSLGGLAA